MVVFSFQKMLGKIENYSRKSFSALENMKEKYKIKNKEKNTIIFFVILSLKINKNNKRDKNK